MTRPPLSSWPLSCVAAVDRCGPRMTSARSTSPPRGRAAAQPAFLRGVLLMHSFEYDDAKEAFLEAQKADPGFAMAYWGEAMTYNHAVWQQTSPDLAKAALARLAPTAEGRLAKAPTAKEKDWLASLDSLYGAGEKLARDRAYAEQMRRMHEKYPADDEVTAFYALALLGTSHGGRDVAIYMKAAALVEQVYARNPQHPGAAHYLIHSYDDPVHAPLGLRFADAYSKIAPAASHALHMPSHIYFALGMWDEASAINERSMKAADARRAEKKLDVEARGFHAMLWLVYGYAQQGRFEESRALLAQLEADAKSSGSVRTRSHLALARAAWLIESRKWGEAKAPVAAKGLATDAAMADLFAIGMAAIRSGNRMAGGNALQQMAALMGDGPASAATTSGAATAGTGGTGERRRAGLRRPATRRQADRVRFDQGRHLAARRIPRGSSRGSHRPACHPPGPAADRRRRAGHGPAARGRPAVLGGPPRGGPGAGPPGRRGRRQPVVRVRPAGARQTGPRARGRDADGPPPAEGGHPGVRDLPEAQSQARPVACWAWAGPQWRPRTPPAPWPPTASCGRSGRTPTRACRNCGSWAWCPRRATEACVSRPLVGETRRRSESGTASLPE